MLSTSDLIQYVKNNIERLQKDLSERDVENFYDMGCTDGEPHGMGNFNDCYDSGYDLGIKEGRLEVFQEMLSKLS